MVQVNSYIIVGKKFPKLSQLKTGLKQYQLTYTKFTPYSHPIDKLEEITLKIQNQKEINLNYVYKKGDHILDVVNRKWHYPDNPIYIGRIVSRIILAPDNLCFFAQYDLSKEIPNSKLEDAIKEMKQIIPDSKLLFVSYLADLEITF